MYGFIFDFFTVHGYYFYKQMQTTKISIALLVKRALFNYGLASV